MNARAGGGSAAAPRDATSADPPSSAPRREHEPGSHSERLEEQEEASSSSPRDRTTPRATSLQSSRSHRGETTRRSRPRPEVTLWSWRALARRGDSRRDPDAHARLDASAATGRPGGDATDAIDARVTVPSRDKWRSFGSLSARTHLRANLAERDSAASRFRKTHRRGDDDTPPRAVRVRHDVPGDDQRARRRGVAASAFRVARGAEAPRHRVGERRRRGFAKSAIEARVRA